MKTSDIHSFAEYEKTYQISIAQPEAFWAEQAEKLTWQKKWDKVLEWDFVEPNIQWFVNGKINITENCLDRHLDKKGDKVALIWEPNDPDEKCIQYTFKELHAEVGKMANVLKNNGVKKGDRVCLYMPMIPELAISIMACARIGAPHSVVFAGFSSQALVGRVEDTKAKVVLTSDGAYRGTKTIPIKTVVDEAVLSCPLVDKIIVVQRTGEDVNMQPDRDVYLHDELKKVNAICPPEAMDAEDALFILYTSGSTGKPKGVVHTTGGYSVFVDYTFRNVFQMEEDDIYWCTADIGWVTGHSYLVYGPLIAGATTVMFEGVPTYPNSGRFWDVIDKYKITHFYTAPTAIRALMAAGEEIVKPYSLASLRVLGSVGEPINEEAWQWYNKNIGKEKCPIVDTWWQTETGGIMISSLAGVTPCFPTMAAYPLPGIQPVLMDKDGNEITDNEVEGYLCIKFPWPGMLRTTYGDHERFKKTYFSAYKGKYFSGDGARRDSRGLYRIIGRVDDVINVSGHRFGTAEIENAINQNIKIVESAVVGYPHDIKGQGIYAYVILTHDAENESIENVKTMINETIIKEIGHIAKPDKVQIVKDLPKTRSGKIMRRILRKIAENEISNVGDTSSLLNPQVVEDIIQGRV
ncbi:MAG: acetate--CoA ligase [Chitinophagales bacterium]|nr:acetate--CoA ligase [Chitinophagales bacterium]